MLFCVINYSFVRLFEAKLTWNYFTRHASCKYICIKTCNNDCYHTCLDMWFEEEFYDFNCNVCYMNCILIQEEIIEEKK